MTPNGADDTAAYGMANEAISRLEDANMRSAFLAIRSEFYHVWDRLGNKTVELQKLVAQVASELQSYTRERAAQDRAEIQRQESIERLFREFVGKLDEHMKSDNLFQQGASRWLIGTLVSIIGALLVVVAAFVWQGLKH